MAKKSITQRFGEPTVGKGKLKPKPQQSKSAKVVKVLPRKGVLLEFIGESPSKEWLTKGTRLVVRGRLDCHGRPYVRVSLKSAAKGKPAVFCVAPTAVKAAKVQARRVSK